MVLFLKRRMRVTKLSSRKKENAFSGSEFVDEVGEVLPLLLPGLGNLGFVGIGVGRRLVSDVAGVFPDDVSDGLDGRLALVENLVHALLDAGLATHGGLHDDVVDLSSQQTLSQSFTLFT